MGVQRPAFLGLVIGLEGDRGCYVECLGPLHGQAAPPQTAFVQWSDGYPLLGAFGSGVVFGDAAVARRHEAQQLGRRLVRKNRSMVHPWERTGSITMVCRCRIGGILGAKFFHLLGVPRGDGGVFSVSPRLQGFIGGLTIYGGLIVGGLAVAIYASAHGFLF